MEVNICKMICRSFLLIIFIHPVLPKAGTLDDFESAKQESPPEERSEDSHDRMSYSDEEDGDDSFSEQLIKFMFEGLWYLALYGGQLSYERELDQSEEQWIAKREIGELLIPHYRFDAFYQKANDDITAQDFRFEFGEKMFGVQLRYTVLTEENPSDELRFTQLHGLYRMSFGNHLGINFGIGLAKLQGNNNDTSLSLAFPVYYHPSKQFGIELKSSIALFENAGILDVDYSFLLSRDKLSMALGYRQLTRAGVDIRGPYVGFSFHY